MKYLIAISMILVGCGKASDSNQDAPTAQGKALHSNWTGLFNDRADLSQGASGAFYGQSCTCTITVQGTDASGTYLLQNCTSGCNPGSGYYANDGKTLQLCAEAALTHCEPFQ